MERELQRRGRQPRLHWLAVIQGAREKVTTWRLDSGQRKQTDTEIVERDQNSTDFWCRPTLLASPKVCLSDKDLDAGMRRVAR